MRLVINILLVALILGLIWVLISSIREPIAFKRELQRRENAVKDRLMKVRTAQEAYRDMTGAFAGSFDTLINKLENDSFRIISVIGDPDDPDFTGTIEYDTTYRPAFDSMRSVLDLSDLDTLRFVPYSGGAQFQVEADTIEYQNTDVNVVEVGTPYKSFMGRYGDERFQRYDQRYDPNKVIKFGDLNRPNLSGNWEN